MASDARPSPQVLFNAAQAAFDRSDWPAAVSGYRAALSALKPSAAAIPVIHARLAAALQRSGQRAEAETEARLAIARFKEREVGKDDDLALSYALLANLHRGASDNDLAITEYQNAIATMATDSPAALLEPRYGLASAALTANPNLAASTLDSIITNAPVFASISKTDQANVLSTRAMAELNRGQAKLAASYIEKALTLTGRTTTKVNIAQVQIRGNAALIYAKLGDEENVRQYLTYSGAGHLPDGSWLSAAEKDLPVCDSVVGPNDFAVVDFAIGDDGRARGADTVYASRPGQIGATFAAAVNTWRWKPDALAKLNPFWRASVRLELRCVTRPPLLRLNDSFRTATSDWLAKSGYDPELAKGIFDPHATGVAPVPAAFTAFWKADGDRAVAAAGATLNAVLIAANAPIDVRAYAIYLAAAPQSARGVRGYQAARGRSLATAAHALDNVAGAEHARAWLQTEYGLALEASYALAPAKTALQAVAALPLSTLPADDPIRSLAVLHLALIDKRSGAPAVADQRISDAGIDAEQCSLLDVRPVARNADISSSTFPEEALRWHFEGTVREAFDIAADGRVQNVRTVLSYPPFVFGPATERAVGQFRYLPPTLGNQVLGCVGQTVNVSYKMPS
ncbi:energy transducer TonB [Sphingomonas sp. RB3P16]|uniref:energy transducer TonB n=1 Tax=Parasphingomonas frigoris TaxID=3096163 RepID=UPI002FC6379B